MKLAMAITPASTNSLATSPTRRMFSARSSAEKPRLLLRPCLPNASLAQHVYGHPLPGQGRRSERCPTPDVVAVEQRSEHAPLAQRVLQRAGHGGLAGPAEAGEPDHAAALGQQALLALPRHGAALPGDVGGLRGEALCRPAAGARHACPSPGGTLPAEGASAVRMLQQGRRLGGWGLAGRLSLGQGHGLAGAAPLWPACIGLRGRSGLSPGDRPRGSGQRQRRPAWRGLQRAEAGLCRLPRISAEGRAQVAAARSAGPRRLFTAWQSSLDVQNWGRQPATALEPSRPQQLAIEPAACGQRWSSHRGGPATRMPRCCRRPCCRPSEIRHRRWPTTPRTSGCRRHAVPASF